MSIHSKMRSKVVVKNKVLINWKIKIGKIARSRIQTQRFNQGGNR